MRTKKKIVAKVTAKTPRIKIGAASALERLENEEARLFAEYQSAKKGKDPLEIKISHAAWIKTSECLRKFDILIEAARREVGELIPRSSVEQWLDNMGTLLHWSLLSAVQDPEEAWGIFKGAFAGFIHNHNAKKSAPCYDVPAWMFKALFESLAGGSGPALWRSFRRMSAVADALALHPHGDEKCEAYLQEEFRKIELENPPTKG